MNRHMSMRAVTPHHAVPRNRSRRSAQISSLRPVAPLRSRSSHVTGVSSVNLDWEGEGLQMRLSELDRYSLRVRSFRSISIRLTHFTCAFIASSLSLKALLPSITAAISAYHLFTWCRTCPPLLGFLAGLALSQTSKHVEYFHLLQRGIHNIRHGRF